MKRIVEKSVLGRAWVLADDRVDKSDDLVKNILARRGIDSDVDIQRLIWTRPQI